MGHPPRPGRRLPGADGRHRRQRPRRPRDRRGIRVQVAQAVRHPREPAGQRRHRSRGRRSSRACASIAETARRARRLVALRDDLPLELDWDALKTDRPDVKAHSRRSASSAASTGSSTSSAPAEPDGRRWPAWEADYRVVDTPELFEAFLAELRRQPRFCVDTETTGLDPLRGLARRACRSAGRPARPITCRSAGRSDCQVLDPDAGRSTRSRPDPGRSRGREGRPEHQVRHARARPRGGRRSTGRSPTR